MPYNPFMSMFKGGQQGINPGIPPGGVPQPFIPQPGLGMGTPIAGMAGRFLPNNMIGTPYPVRNPGEDEAAYQWRLDAWKRAQQELERPKLQFPGAPGQR